MTSMREFEHFLNVGIGSVDGDVPLGTGREMSLVRQSQHLRRCSACDDGDFVQRVLPVEVRKGATLCHLGRNAVEDFFAARFVHQQSDDFRIPGMGLAHPRRLSPQALMRLGAPRLHQDFGIETKIHLKGRREERTMAAPKIRPLHDRVLVTRIDDEEQKTAGGVIIPDTAREKPQKGKIQAVGNGKIGDDGKRIAMDVKRGDRVLFGKYAGNEIKENGTEYLIMREDDILAVLD